MRVYVAAPFDLRELVSYMAASLESEGHVITYKWFDAELAVQATQDNVGEKRVREIATLELAGVVSADALLVLYQRSGGTGVWWECGMAAAAGVPIFALSARCDGKPPYRSIFDSFTTPVESLDEFKVALTELEAARAAARKDGG